MKIKISALLLAVFASGVATSSHAAPVGPSAKAAASLKKNPTSAWLAHYLPDDRYKIAGGVWKYVTTNLDTYYHVPSSSNMMSQPNDGVIGFPSAQAAEEAGYKPDPRDGTLQQVRGNLEKKQFAMEQESAQAAQNGGKRSYIKPSGRVILGDGRSTMVVPADWMRIASDQQTQEGRNFSIDLMLHQKSKKIALLLTMTVPNVDVGRQLSSGQFANNMKRFGAAANSSGEISNSGAGKIGDWMMQAKVRRTRWGGLNGVVVSPPPSDRSKAGNLLMVGRGNKAYMFMMAGEGQTPTSTSQMIKSFVPR